jgi:hypothetical protein
MYIVLRNTEIQLAKEENQKINSVLIKNRNVCRNITFYLFREYNTHGT